MSAKQPGKGWGSFLQGAVAGLESRLDTILAEDDQASARSRADDSLRKKVAAEQSPSRTPSRSRTNDRLQERLAKAVKSDAPRSARASSELPSRTGTPINGADTSRTSVDSRTSEIQPSSAQDEKASAPTASNDGDGDAVPKTADQADKAEEKATLQPEEGNRLDVGTTDSLRVSTDSSRPDTPIDAPSRAETPASISETASCVDLNTSANESEDVLALRQSYEELTKTHRAEMTAHLERIDALQSKLKYLSGQAVSQARTAANEADQGSFEQKLAQKDEQIALLMEEGQTLSKKELTLSTNIKNFRAKTGQHEKTIIDLKKKLTKAETSASEATERAKRAEAAARSAEQRVKQLEKVEKEASSLKSEREDSTRTIAELKRQLSAANERAEAAEKKAQNNAAAAEQRRVSEIEEELSDLKVEKKLAEDRAKAEAREIREESTRQRERATVLETELRSEITNLETKLEVLRSRSEEHSSNPSGDSQIKLLRQIDTLQTQYSLASENWQGIESSLTGRVAALEKERDELAKRESDIRRKAREVNSKSRKLEEELDNTSDQARSLEHDLAEQKTQMVKLQSRLAQVEKELESTKANFEQQKRAWEVEMAQKIDEEKTKWRLESTMSPVSGAGDSQGNFLTPQTPSLPGTMFGRKHSGDQSLGLISSRRGASRNVSSELLLSLDTQQQPRRLGSSQRTPGFPGTPQRQDSSTSTNTNGQHNGSLHPGAPPSIHTVDDSADAFFERRSSSPHRTVADMISVSTVGNAGPSVQLVERMSAAVRRLESEKAVSKEELARLSAQRDEAREEVVALMREVDEKRAQSRLVEQLRRELREVEVRYETTLEALGEKSEQVEELQNDVDDLKKIYKDLVERTMK